MAPQSPSSSPRVAGIDRWRQGWIIACRDGDRIELHCGDDVAAAVGLTADCSVVAIDMPIALVVTGQRQAELALRARLGSAGRSVFISPTRAAINAVDQATATQLNRANGGQGISAQAWGLAPSIRELRRAFRAPAQGRHWFETHPESAFAEMNDGVALASKKSALGVGQRLGLLSTWVDDLDALLRTSPPKVPVDDVLDALAACWSAERIAQGSELVIGQPGPDDQGFERSIRI